MTDVPRYMPNDQPLRALSKTPKELFQAALEEFIEKNGVPETFEDGQLIGIFAGFTGISYLLLQLSKLHPDLQVHGESLLQLAKRYMKVPPDAPMLEQDIECGLISEKLGREALTACLSGDDKDVERFIASTSDAASPTIPTSKTLANEILYGRAGVLFLLRLVRYWVPGSRARLEMQMQAIADRIMEANNHGQDSWVWADKKFLGAVHGDIGIITQLVLCLPHLAPVLQPHLLRLLAMQFDDGNWPKLTDGSETASEIVQFCHGAPGFVISLQALRPYYPHLSAAFDKAIAKGIDIIWTKGLLLKEPALCHGILGNALALPRGEKRDHFLALVEPQATEEMKENYPDAFGTANYGMRYCIPMIYSMSAVWVWGVCEQECPPFFAFSDV
ncbi:Lanthionine synthetase [Cordyceps fumosorosea ARSEF 2679]|uniref:Lanthionine synthetase n=1 Tax=Cordyceps fumosorosea (strain ARSEF 2679) TaxID=1081104 RepID=A0A168D362_CORFA|nr:Lanthionine synthetase [Cordyceps fumosorosea ARSEF 2679]OAA72113.1 Lanthionine synthetase [Cordyceps fumosorosea ARSEF 2679]